MSRHGLKSLRIPAYFAGLRVRLFLMVLLAIVPALALTIVSYSEQRQGAIDDVQSSALRLTRLVASEHENRIENARTLLVAMSRLPEVHGDGLESCIACGELFADLLKRYPDYASFGAANLKGDVFCSGRVVPEPVNIADRSFFQRAIQSRDLAFGEYRMGSLAHKPVSSLGYPIVDEEGQVEGVVFVELDLGWLDDFMIEAAPPEGSTLCLLDGDGRVLLHSPPRFEALGELMSSAGVVEVALRGEGVTDAPGSDGISRLYSFVRLSNMSEGPLYVSIGIPKEIAFAEMNRTLVRNLTIFGLVVLLAVVLAWAGGGFFIIRPVNTLLGMTKRLAAGDLKARAGIGSSGGELYQLGRAFDSMAETLEQREVERRQAEESVRREATRAASLVRVADRLNARLDLETVLKAVCEETSRALNVPIAIVSLYEKGKDSLNIWSQCGLPPELCGQLRSVPRGRLEDYARLRGNAIVVSDVLAEAGLSGAEPSAQMPTLAGAAASMWREQQFVGVLCIVPHDESRDFSQDDLMLLKGLADQAAQAITNARLYALLKLEGQTRAHLIHKIITAQEDERNRIARELHDQTVQDVTLLMMNLDLGRKSETTDAGTADRHLLRSRDIAEEALDSLRRIIGDLRPPQLDDLGLGSAIAWYGEQRLKPLGLSLVLSGNALERRLPAMTETALFRIAQEALTNTVKHSDANVANVSLQSVNGRVIMEVRDDGKGFQSQNIGMVHANGGGLGLSGMKERASLLGGEFCLRTSPGTGTRISVSIPLAEESQDA